MTYTSELNRLGDRVLSWRSGIIENTHIVHAAVVDADGKLLLAAGDPGRLTLARSAIKPAQALAILGTPGIEQYEFDKKDIALMCASHNSEEKHIAQATKMLQATGTNEAEMRCGGHPSMNPAVNIERAKSDYTPTAINNNCSGKHIGMLGASRVLNADAASYHQLHHPIQARVQQAVESLSGLPAEEIRWGVDGCNLPAPALPLYGLAQLFANLAVETKDGGPESPHSDPKTVNTLAHIFDSMAQHADLVGGEGRFCTDLMQAFEGRLVGKVGADGCYGISIRPRDDIPHRLGNKPIGIAVKVEDGDLVALYAAVMEILEQLDVGNSKIRERLSGYHQPERINTAGVVVGSYSFSLKLREV